MDKDDETEPQDKQKEDKQTPCPHERTKNEYYKGRATGDMICLDCGRLI